MTCAAGARAGARRPVAGARVRHVPVRFVLSPPSKAYELWVACDCAGQLGFSAAGFFAFDDPFGFAQIGLAIWPERFRSDRSEQDASRERLNLEYFLCAAIYPFELGAIRVGFYLLLTSASLASDQGYRATLGPSVLWSISEHVWLHYQLGFSTETNLVNAGLASSLSLDIAP